MQPIFVHSNATHGPVGATTTDNAAYAQRRGSTSTLNWTADGYQLQIIDGTYGFAVGVDQHTRGRIAVELSSGPSSARTMHIEQCVRDMPTARAMINSTFETLKQPFRLSTVTLAYCFGSVLYDYERTDRFLAPLRYDAEAGEASFPDGTVVLSFHDPDSYAVTLTEELVPEKLRDIARAHYPGWIHDCDVDRGWDYVRRRLTWLAGATILHHAISPVACWLLERDLETTTAAA